MLANGPGLCCWDCCRQCKRRGGILAVASIGYLLSLVGEIKAIFDIQVEAKEARGCLTVCILLRNDRLELVNFRLPVSGLLPPRQDVLIAVEYCELRRVGI